jgi:RNA polymerase sigma-70 factor (ECF subfamily)
MMNTNACNCVSEKRSKSKRDDSAETTYERKSERSKKLAVSASPSPPRTEQQNREAELIRLAIAGDNSALETLFVAGRPQLHRVAVSVLGNTEDAEDAVQEGLLSAYRNLPRFQGRSRFSTWLTRIVLNAALMSRRRRKRKASTSLEDYNPSREILELQVIDTRPTPEQAVFLEEKRHLINSSVAQLTPMLQSAFRLRHFGSLSTREAARFLGVNAKVMKSRSWRARQELARVLPSLLAGRGEVPRGVRSYGQIVA